MEEVYKMIHEFQHQFNFLAKLICDQMLHQEKPSPADQAIIAPIGLHRDWPHTFVRDETIRVGALCHRTLAPKDQMAIVHRQKAFLPTPFALKTTDGLRMNSLLPFMPEETQIIIYGPGAPQIPNIEFLGLEPFTGLY